jgi:CHAT domain-containing protein
MGWTMRQSVFLLSIVLCGQTLPFTGAPVTADIASSETHTYQLLVPAGLFADLKVSQLQGDVTCTLQQPDGKEYATTDRIQYGGAEDLAWIAGAAGSYRIEIRGVKGRAAKYRIEAEVRAPSEADLARANGFRIGWADSKLLLNPKTGDGFRKLAAVYELAAAEFQKAGDIKREAYTLTEWANAIFGLAEYKKALELYLRAVEMQRRVPDEPQVLGTSLVSLGAIRTALGQTPAAMSAYEEALKVFPLDAAMGDQANAVNAIGNGYARLGDNAKALPYKQRAMEMRRKIGDKLGIGSSLVGMASYYYNLRDLQKAIELAAEALPIFVEIKEEVWEARTLSELGVIYAELRESTKATQYWQRSEEIYRRYGHANGLAGVLYGLGGLKRREGDFRASERYFQEATDLNRKAGYAAGLSRTLAGLCDMYAASKQWEKVRPAGEEALALARKIGAPLEQSRPLRCLGEAAKHDKAYGEAEKLFQEALAIARRINDRGEEMRVLGELSDVALAHGDLASAISHMEQSVAIAETDALRLPDVELRARYRASRSSMNEAHLHLLMSLHGKDAGAGYAERAFDVVERVRARSLAELINTNSTPALDASQKRSENSLLAAVTAAQRELFREETPASRRAQLRVVLAKAERELDLFQSVSFAGREAGFVFEAWDTGRTRQELAGADGVVVSFSLGTARSYVWALTAQGVVSAVLPGRQAIEERVGAFRKLVGRPVSALTAARAMPAIDAEASELHRMLIAPIAGALGGKKRLLIIPDGALAYLPFEAIGAGRKLIEAYSVAYAPSASTAGALRDRGTRRAPAPKTLLAFADPSLRPSAVMQSQVERGFSFTALPNARAEVSSISGLFPPSSTRTYVGAAATEGRVKAEALAEYKYLHFAAHGYFDEEEPRRSGIVLAQIADAAEDGFLQAREVMGLRLNSDLVTLSACQSGLGKLLAGEGVQGLARAFFHAGAQSVLVSLWNVDDTATADLMKRFYTNLKAGAMKDDALHRAKLALIKAEGGRWRHPYYWAPFVLTGQAR